MKYKILFLFLMAFVIAFSQTASISVSPSDWFAGSIDLWETIEMVCSDSIRITNTGSVPVDLSLRVSSVIDGVGSPMCWFPAFITGDDCFVLRAEFTEVSVPPTSYSPALDYLRITWANATETMLGPDGYNIPPGETQYLWFEFISPNISSYFGEFSIVVNLKASPHSVFEGIVMTDTIIDIDIHSALRYPPCLPLEIYIFDIECGADSEYVYFKSDLGPGERSDYDFYLVYRAPWALFGWSDIQMFGLSDTACMIDPIEDPMTYFDAGMYRWGWKEEPAPGEDSVWVGPNYTYDFFYDTLLSVSASRGVCDPDTNWFYTAVAVDTDEYTGELIYPPYTADPVAEYDQWIVNGASGTMNIVSYAVEVFDVEDSLGSASSFGRIIPNCICVAEWDAASQDTITLAKKDGASWTNYGYITTGKAYIVYLAPGAPDSAIFSLCCPGYVPFDDDESWSDLTAPSTSMGFNLIAVPYQKYNVLLSYYGSFPLPARILGEDISEWRSDLDVCYIARWNPETQSGDTIAIDSSGTWIGNNPVYPGEPLMIYIAGSLYIKEYFPNRHPNTFLSIFPNPFNSSVAITAPAGAGVEIYDLRGNVITPFGSANAEPLSPLSRGTDQSVSDGQGVYIWHPDKSIPSGIYFVKATMDDGTTVEKRVVYLK